MGASNAIAAFKQYAGLVPPTSLLLLVRMALTAKDSEPEPWYEWGHEALARDALGRGRHAEVSRSDVAAVERAIAPLRKVGAISTDRRPARRRDERPTVKYRLHLKAPNVPRKPLDVEAPPDLTQEPQRPTETVGSENPQRPTETVGSTADNVPRFPEQRPTVSGATSHGNRGTPYKEEEKKEKKEVESGRAIGRAPVPRRSDTTALATVVRIPTGEHPVVPQTGAATIGVGITETANTITAGWIDHCRNNGVTLPRDVIGRYAKAIKQALDDGFDANLIKRALVKMREDGQASWPHSFGAHLVRIQEATTAERARRKLTPGEESAKRLVEGADNPGEVIDAVSRFFERGSAS